MKYSLTFAALAVASNMVPFATHAFSIQNTSTETNRRNFLQSIATVTAAASGSAMLSPSPVLAEDGFTIGGKLKYGDESIMSPKAHGTSESAVQESLRYGVSNKLADRITNYNRRFAELGKLLFLLGLSF